MNRFLVVLLLLLGQVPIFGQTDSLPSLKMRAEVGQDTVIALRWAPTNAKAWKLLNTAGVRLERVLVYADGAVLDDPTTTVLAECLRPDTTAHFKAVAQQYSYGAIIAQAVFGEHFDISSGQSGGISSMIAQSEQDEQRFVLSLYAADLCFPAAQAAGWGFVDSTVVYGNKYLYRVVPLVPIEQYAIEQGAVFVEPARKTRLVRPMDFRASFIDSTALLSWNYRALDFLYNSYMPERSIDGLRFHPISTLPVTKMGEGSKSGNVIYVDPISNYQQYYYRLRGVTSFGNYGPYSDTIRGTALPELKTPPVIVRAVPNETGGADLAWEFDSANEVLVTDFTLERSDDNKNFGDFATKIDKSRRSLSIKSIKASNYFVLSANTITGTRKRSFSVFVQPADTIPPAVPRGLRAVADTSGAVHLLWEPNTDADIYGYRLYRGQTGGEELVVLNDIAIRETSYVDSVSMKNLNTKIYYALTALDERYNQSEQCAVVAVVKPELIPPTAPFITEIKVENGKNVLSWVSGSEENLAGYDVHRDSVLIAKIAPPTTLKYEDQVIENGKPYNYVVYSRSVGGLRSEGSVVYSVVGLNKGTPKRSGVEFSVLPDKELARVKWSVKNSDIFSVQLYKKMDDAPYSLFQDGLDDSGAIEDKNVFPTKAYEYMLVVKFNNAQPLSLTKSFQF